MEPKALLLQAVAAPQERLQEARQRGRCNPFRYPQQQRRGKIVAGALNANVGERGATGYGRRRGALFTLASDDLRFHPLAAPESGLLAIALWQLINAPQELIR